MGEGVKRVFAVGKPPPLGLIFAFGEKMRKRTKLLLAACIVVTLAGAATYRADRDHFSCVQCRGFRYVDNQSVFGVRVAHQERYEEGYLSGSPAPHPHEWWLYSRHTVTCGLKTFECQSHRFADGVDLETVESGQVTEATPEPNQSAVHR